MMSLRAQQRRFRTANYHRNNHCRRSNSSIIVNTSSGSSNSNTIPPFTPINSPVRASLGTAEPLAPPAGAVEGAAEPPAFPPAAESAAEPAQNPLPTPLMQAWLRGLLPTYLGMVPVKIIAGWSIWLALRRKSVPSSPCRCDVNPRGKVSPVQR